jgi:outer membrane protein OmpA-like peptidoglycan-associated protein
MTGGRWPLALTLAVAAALAGCGPRNVRTPTSPNQTLVVLAADADGTAGAATVSNQAGSADLTDIRAATIVVPGGAPARPRTLSEADVQAIFGAALAALPRAPRQFTLYFRFDSEELTQDSRGLVQDVLGTIKGDPSASVTVIGHTDTTGSAASNFALGLRRANAVRLLLESAGLPRAAIDVTSLGEQEPLVKTADGVFEPRNRRVELTVQ